MSRAFVAESDGLDGEQIPEYLDLLPAGSRNYMTAEGAERLRSELNGLISGERAVLAASLKRLGESGNETGALKQARYDLMMLERKIEYLSHIASTMEIVAPRTSNTDSIGFGAAVTVRDAGGAQKTFRIVGAYEADPDAGTVSRASPLAKALIGKRVGDKIDFRLPEGEERLIVLAVSYSV